MVSVRAGPPRLNGILAEFERELPRVATIWEPKGVILRMAVGARDVEGRVDKWNR